MAEPLPTARFNHATLNCKEVGRSISFYESVLGFRQVARPNFDFVGSWLYRDGLGMMLHLIEDTDFHQPREQINSRVSHLAFRVTDVDTAVDRLTQHGVPFMQKRLPDHGYRQIFFHDPDGNVIEVGEWPDVETMVASIP